MKEAQKIKEKTDTSFKKTEIIKTRFGEYDPKKEGEIAELKKMVQQQRIAAEIK